MAKRQRTRSQQAQDRKEKRTKMFMGVFIVALMVLSSFAFILVYYAPGGDVAAQGRFEIRDGLLFATVDGREMHFYSQPDQYPIPQEAITLIRDASVLVVAFDPTDQENLPYVEQARFDLTQYLDTQVAGAILSPSDQYEYPVASCQDATTQAPILRLINGTYDISVNESCITLAGQQDQILLLRDQLLFEYYGFR